MDPDKTWTKTRTPYISRPYVGPRRPRLAQQQEREVTKPSASAPWSLGASGSIPACTTDSAQPGWSSLCTNLLLPAGPGFLGKLPAASGQDHVPERCRTRETPDWKDVPPPRWIPSALHFSAPLLTSKGLLCASQLSLQLGNQLCPHAWPVTHLEGAPSRTALGCD